MQVQVLLLVPEHSGSPFPHTLSANPEDLVLVRYNSPYLLKELFSS